MNIKKEIEESQFDLMIIEAEIRVINQQLEWLETEKHNLESRINYMKGMIKNE